MNASLSEIDVNNTHDIDMCERVNSENVFAAKQGTRNNNFTNFTFQLVTH